MKSAKDFKESPAEKSTSFPFGVSKSNGEFDSAMLSKTNQSRAEIALGLVSLVGILYLVYVAIGWIKSEVLDATGYVLYADFASVSGLNIGDPVQIAGVQIGSVEFISLADYQAHVALRIKDDVTIHENAVASIKAEGLIGDRAVSIDPGISGQPLGPGEKIKETESAKSLQYLLGKLVAGDII